MTDIIAQLQNLVNEAEFSDRVQDKVKELSVKARLRKESGKKEEDCLITEEKDELIGLIKVDMVLDGVEIEGYKTYLAEIDKLINSLGK